MAGDFSVEDWGAAFAAFGLKAPLRVEPLPGGVTNAVVKIVLARAKRVVRRHGRSAGDAETIERRCDVVARLSGVGAPVARPLRTLNGSFTHAGGFTYSASEFVPGATDAGAASPAAYGAMLATLHAATARLSRDARLAQRSCDRLDILAALFAKAAPSLGFDWPGAARIAASCAARLRRLDYAALPSAWVHGDANPGNIVVDRGNLAAFIDFDLLHYSERLYDIATLTGELTWNLDDPVRAGAIGRELLEGYAARNPLTPAELTHLHLLRIRRNLEMIGRRLARDGSLDAESMPNATKNLTVARDLLQTV